MGFRYATGRLYKPRAVAFEDLEFTYTGAVQTTTLPAGTYLFKLWGAKGGELTGSTWGGLGGYAEGRITLTESTLVRIYVGQQAPSTTGGWNGGGDGGTGRPSGGGGTDIRIGGTDLIYRVLVAGGGGGSGSQVGRYGGVGGGTTGGDGAATSPGTGGTQSAGGTANGAWGQGGVSTGGGGGGGWYGGGAAGSTFHGGGGGSSYIGGTVETEGESFPLIAITDGSTTAGQREGNGLAQISKVG